MWFLSFCWLIFSLCQTRAAAAALAAYSNVSEGGMRAVGIIIPVLEKDSIHEMYFLCIYPTSTTSM